MDGSTNIPTTFTIDHDQCTACGRQHAGPDLANICIGCPCDSPRHQIHADPTCSRSDHLTSSCQHATEPVTSDRPVMPVVARMLDDELDFLEQRARLGEPLTLASSVLVLGEVRRLRVEVEQHAGDAATIGTLAAAVGKVAQLHTDDGDGWCKACQTIGYPCPTVLALGAGQ